MHSYQSNTAITRKAEYNAYAEYVSKNKPIKISTSPMHVNYIRQPYKMYIKPQSHNTQFKKYEYK